MFKISNIEHIKNIPINSLLIGIFIVSLTMRNTEIVMKGGE